MTVWFTSDLHFGHANIIRYSGRPFVDLDEMHRELVKRWNDRVAPEDTVYVLGDAHLGKIDLVTEWVPRLNGTKLLFPGNHDLCHEGHKGRTSKVERARTAFHLAGFDMIWSGVAAIDIEVGGWLCTAAHYPYRNDHPDHPDLPTLDQRYREDWPPEPPGGRWHLHGHIHERWRSWPETRQVNVGVDVWDWAPVSEWELAGLIAEWA